MSTMEQALDYVLKLAANKKLDLEILATEKTTTTVQMQARKVEQFGFSESRELGVRVVSGLHEGIAFTESLDEESLEETVNEAAANSRMITKETASELRGSGSLPKMDFLFNRGLQDV